MGGDVPKELVRLVREIPQKFRENSSAYILAASFVIYHYLEFELISDDGSKRIFDTNSKHEEDLRILILAEAVFSLRAHPGFLEICRRLRSRDLRSAFFEVYTASIFAANNFEIHARPEIRSKGSDFDFQVAQAGAVINVEVTALTGASVLTVRNALLKKRSQLPSDRPSVIAIYIPRDAGDITERASELEVVVDQFLKKTRRVNYVFVMQEMFVKQADKHGWFLRGFDRRNPNPRRQSLVLNRIARRGHPQNANFRAAAENLSSLSRTVGFSEFWSWVDAQMKASA